MKRIVISNGRARIFGTTIEVWVVLKEIQGKTWDQILSLYPRLTMADIELCRAYGKQHPEEITEDEKNYAATLQTKESLYS